jgi:hypothetical protein
MSKGRAKRKRGAERSEETRQTLDTFPSSSVNLLSFARNSLP